MVIKVNLYRLKNMIKLIFFIISYFFLFHKLSFAEIPISFLNKSSKVIVCNDEANANNKILLDVFEARKIYNYKLREIKNGDPIVLLKSILQENLRNLHSTRYNYYTYILSELETNKKLKYLSNVVILGEDSESLIAPLGCGQQSVFKIDWSEINGEETSYSIPHVVIDSDLFLSMDSLNQVASLLHLLFVIEAVHNELDLEDPFPTRQYVGFFMDNSFSKKSISSYIDFLESSGYTSVLDYLF